MQALLKFTTPDHLVYGTDYPYVAPHVIKANIERMKNYLSVAERDSLIIRIAEIEVHDGYLEPYLAAAHNVGTKSVETEPGVICIFPMQVKEQPNTIRIVEIYRDKEAYQAHLQTPHSLDYKQGTLHTFVYNGAGCICVRLSVMALSLSPMPSLRLLAFSFFYMLLFVHKSFFEKRYKLAKISVYL